MKEGGGGGGVGAERDVSQEGFREQTWQSVMVGDRWVKKCQCDVIIESSL